MIFEKILNAFGIRKVSKSIGYLVVGIGNVGAQYDNTRHNIGFDIVDKLIDKAEIVERNCKCQGNNWIGTFKNDKHILFTKPLTYVNKSGLTVNRLMEQHLLEPEQCLVIVDDFNIPLGSMRFRRKGTDGGHNGLKSIIKEIGENFPRLRIGIGPKPANSDVISFVLGKFDKSEIEKKQKIIDLSVKAIEHFCNNDLESMINNYSKRSI